MSKHGLFKKPSTGQSSLQDLPVAYMQNRMEDVSLNAALEFPPLQYVSTTNSFETQETIEELHRSVSATCISRTLLKPALIQSGNLHVQ